MKKTILLAILGIFFLGINAQAYIKDYPPYSFKEGLPNALNIQPIKRNTLPDSKNLSLANAWDKPLPMETYRLDLDKNGLEDKVVFSWRGGCGLASMCYRVDIFLKDKTGHDHKISYDTMNPDIQDFSDLNHDGKSEVIITGYYQGKKHNYFSYDVYQFDGFKLKNADKQFKGFPKFIWLTNKPNDKDTTHLTQKERAEHVREKNSSIIYKVI